MNITHLRPNRSIFILAVICAAMAWGIIGSASASAAGKPSPTVAPKSDGAGRLVILRSANLGSAVVGLKIDGVQTALINFNGRYDAPLPAGQHILTVIPVGSRENAKPTQTHVTVENGKTYTFTAKRSDVDIVLK